MAATTSSPLGRCVQLLLALSTLVLIHTSPASADNDTILTSSLDGVATADLAKCSAKGVCKPGLLLPMWLPQENLSGGDRIARAIVYMTALCFLFLGISIISDRFMASIEVITSKEREVTIRRPDGETTVMTVRVWNETVSNLTLMALGSSAPEILLSIIEIIGNNFEAGDLGPSTIVGSAAFNLFVIIGLCCYVIPDGEVRRIKHLRVFFITATLSIFAYLWMYIIIAVSSHGVIDIWEGIVTLLFFPLTVLFAYFADKRIFVFKFLKKRYRTTGHKTIAACEGDVELNEKQNHVGNEEDIIFKGLDSEDAEIREFERHRKEYIEILREIRKKHPNITDMKTLEEMAEIEAMNRGPKSRAFYRIQATRKLTGGGNVVKKAKAHIKADTQDITVVCGEDDQITRIFFEPGHYTVMENVGVFQCTVARQGGNLNRTVYVDYRTEDGTANAGSDYEYAEGTLVFAPGEQHKQFPITIVDDDVFEEDEHFYVRLSNIRVGGRDDMFTGAEEGEAHSMQLANPSMATVMILDDDHAGVFHFETGDMSFPESVGEAEVKVVRSSGARGTVRVPYRTVEGTARGGGKDFVNTEGFLEFLDNETEAFIRVRVIDDEEYEKNEIFYIELDEPQLYKSGELVKFSNKAHSDMTEVERIADLGRPKLGDPVNVTCHIRESMEFKSTVDKLLKKANVSIAVGTSSWREQFVDAITVSAGDDEGDEEGEEQLPSCMDYIMHFLTLFWKVLFAFVPPTDYWNGYAAFFVSIVVIGFLTAIVGDVASHFGCTVGMKDSVTALSFVALGTSLPDYWCGWLCFWVSIALIGLLTAVVGDIASSFGCTVGLKDVVTSITFVALGTSLPDMFASKVAAVGDEYADASVGNVTGSNAVNVFLGIGIAWSVAAIYHAAHGRKFHVEPGSLAFSVTLFCVCAFIAIGIMLLRRRQPIGGELGGPRGFKYGTAAFFFTLWIIYIILSSLEAYCHIKGF